MSLTGDLLKCRLSLQSLAQDKDNVEKILRFLLFICFVLFFKYTLDREAETLGFLHFGTRCVLLYWKGGIILGISYV